ncbi:unnamed protein product [Sphagnum jensenii]|uniref:intramembrane prenyl-peptidase Rce1 n=1 Tax=Sphagnum jensenii TaxID=128206 RepID=A0ABP1AF85_9BRYO
MLDRFLMALTAASTGGDDGGGGGGNRQGLVAIAGCAAMAVLYVGSLYVPSVVLRLPPPRSINAHYLRRFLWSIVASALAAVACLSLLPVKGRQSLNLNYLLSVFGLCTNHLWQATIYPLLLTALLYLGPLVMAAFDCFTQCAQPYSEAEASGWSVNSLANLMENINTLVSNILAWRNYVVAPVTEEWVFRACMAPVLLCGGFNPLSVVFLCPLFFSLAHIHRYWELVHQEKHDKLTAAVIVGIQLCYTTVFGWYATFLFLRTGHLMAPLVAHVFCNVMGLPALGQAFTAPYVVPLSFIAGLGGFVFLLGPASSPALYMANSSSAACSCWLGYCKWN